MYQLSCARSKRGTKSNFGLEGDPVKLLASNTGLASTICLVSLRPSIRKWKGLPARLRRQSNEDDDGVDVNLSTLLAGVPNMLMGDAATESGSTNDDVDIYVDELADGTIVGGSTSGGVHVSVNELNVTSPDARPGRNFSEVNLPGVDTLSTDSSTTPAKKFHELSSPISTSSTPSAFLPRRHGINKVFENARSSARKL